MEVNQEKVNFSTSPATIPSGGFSVNCLYSAISLLSAVPAMVRAAVERSVRPPVRGARFLPPAAAAASGSLRGRRSPSGARAARARWRRGGAARGPRPLCGVNAARDDPVSCAARASGRVWGAGPRIECVEAARCVTLAVGGSDGGRGGGRRAWHIF